MIPRMTDASPVPSGREVIDRVTTPTGEWQLQRREGHYEIICNGVFLMASYNRESDRQLAALALRGVRGDALRVLVGGLGIGFTAQAALEDLRVRQLDVVEVEPAVIAWHRAYFAPLCHWPLRDLRTVLTAADLFEFPLAPQSYDAILLDTDNGPGWLARDINARLYDPGMVTRFITALTRRGVLAVWSADPAPEFERMLAEIAGNSETVQVSEELAPGRPGTAWIYLADSLRS